MLAAYRYLICENELSYTYNMYILLCLKYNFQQQKFKGWSQIETLEIPTQKVPSLLFYGCLEDRLIGI